MWIDSDRAGLFFARKVVICEGASEKILFTYLLETEWSDLRTDRITIVDAAGKYNVHRYIALLAAFAIPHAVVIDGDRSDRHHAVVNDLIHTMCRDHALSEPFIFETDLESYLGLPKPPGSRNDRKPLSVLRAAVTSSINSARLEALKCKFSQLCRCAEDSIT